jgi:hypothetical protein
VNSHSGLRMASSMAITFPCWKQAAGSGRSSGGSRATGGAWRTMQHCRRRRWSTPSRRHPLYTLTRRWEIIQRLGDHEPSLVRFRISQVTKVTPLYLRASWTNNWVH